MAITTRLDLSIWRNDEVYVFPLRVRGPDLTTIPMRAQIRLGPDVPGPPLVDLAQVTNGNAEGVRFAGVSLVDGVYVNDIQIRLNKSTRVGLPYEGEIGDAAVLKWAFQIAGITRLVGDVVILPHAYGSDAAPASRPMSYGGAPATSYPSLGATMTIAGEDVTELSIHGFEFIGPAVAAAQAAQAGTQADRAAVENALTFVQGAPQLLDDTREALLYERDTSGRVVAYRDVTGEQFAVGNPLGLSTQALLRGGVAGAAMLPSTFAPLGTPIAAAARYVWSAMPRDLRPDPAATAIVGYGFQWPPDPVPASQVRRARWTLGSQAWALDQITVANGPCTDFFRVHQYRDLSPMRDRKTGTTWHAVNAIGRAEDGYAGTHFALAKSSDGLAFTLVGYVEVPFSAMQVWSPEWFVDDNGELYIIVSANTFVEPYNNNPSASEAAANPGNLLQSKWGYHLFRIIDLETATCDYVGKLEGASFPTMAAGVNAGHTSMIDPAMFKRNGVYHVIWKAEAARDNPSLKLGGVDLPHGTLGWAASTRLIAGYDIGKPFKLTDGSFLRGEGPSVIELPAGSARRYRLIFDDFLNLYGGGTTYVDTDDFVSFPAGVQPLGVTAPYNRHATFVIGL